MAAVDVHTASYGEQRDDIASLRDVTAELRDRAAEARDLTAAGQNGPGEIPASTFAAFRRLAAADRANAASDRREAHRDRRFATEAGVQASGDGARATADRDQAALDLEHARHDDLTGVFSRERGGVALQNEIDRARRSGESFVLGFIDVDDLKALNDESGHAAGDALLQHVAASMKGKLRSYDPIVRLGGDEFLCGFTNTDLATAQQRVDDIQVAVRSGTSAGSITVGLAKLGDGDTLDDLTARADRDMYTHKQHGRPHTGDRAPAPVRPGTIDTTTATTATSSTYVDTLTGTYVPAFGDLALQKEIDRARGVGEPFVLAVIQVRHLRERSGRSGPAAGDVLLQHIANAVALVTRACDPLVRMPGDRFLCGLTDTDLAGAIARVARIHAGLRLSERFADMATISVGVAELGSGDTLATLAARANRDVKPAPTRFAPATF